ncbi:hypothetical protein [Enterococcus sp. UD-01]|jgi:hypothetical protein|uniref:hypothetical protein n=1 Tax=Enterococcus sp. UD-01 TaxID=3373911 RepID=UPI003833850B
MTEKTLKHELYKHGSYLISLKESGSSFINIDDEIKKLEELFQLASKKDTPPFAIGEYYATEDGKKIVKILGNVDNQIEYYVYDAQYGTFKKWYIPEKDMTAILPDLAPATVEQIATFKRAEQFAAKGRKWSEFKKGDKVLNNNTGRIGIVESVDEDGDAVVNYNSEGPLSIRDYKCTGALYLDLIQTAEEPQELES